MIRSSFRLTFMGLVAGSLAASLFASCGGDSDGGGGGGATVGVRDGAVDVSRPTDGIPPSEGRLGTAGWS